MPGAAAGHTTIAHTPGPEGLIGRAGGGSSQLQSGASGGAGVHGQVCVVQLMCTSMVSRSTYKYLEVADPSSWPGVQS